MYTYKNVHLCLLLLLLLTVKVDIFAHFAAKWSGAKIKPREYYVKMCVCVCKLVVREIKNMRNSSF